MTRISHPTVLVAALAVLAAVGTASGTRPAHLPPGGQNQVLTAPFSSTPIVVDGLVDEAWRRATPAPLTFAMTNDLAGPAPGCAAEGQVRAMWDGALLYLLVSVRDPFVTTSAASLADKDGVEFWIDHFDDKFPKFEEDDGTMTVSAPPAAMAGNRAQNEIYPAVHTRYLKAFASAYQADATGRRVGYNVEVAWHLGEHARAGGARFGFDFAINEAGVLNRRECRVFWNRPTRRTTDDNSEWGTVVLSGDDRTAPRQLDTFMLERNIAKAAALPRGIWASETELERAVPAARAALVATSQPRIDAANRALDAALRGLRRKGPFLHGTGPFPDPLDLPEVDHLNDPFTFFDGSRVRSAADWDRRRAEIRNLAQYYEFGYQPPAPASLEAAATASAEGPAGPDYRTITVSMAHNGRRAAFSARLTVPSASQAAASGRSAPFPVIVSMDMAAATGHQAYLDAGYAVLSIPTWSIASDNVAHAGAFYALHPYDVTTGHDAGCLVAWAWGASRAVDALHDLASRDPVYAKLIDLDRLAVTGFSRWGKAALLAGFLDDRFKVTAPGASGSGGAAPYRYDSFGNTPGRKAPFGNVYAWGRSPGAEVMGDHVRHQTHNSNEMFRRFLNDAVPATVQGRMYKTRTHGYGERLPFDHHLEIAAIAPRAVLIQSTNDDYANNAEGDAIGYEGARPVYRFLHAADKLALDIYMGGGGHSPKPSQRANLIAFCDFVLYGIALPAVGPPGDGDHPASTHLYTDPYLTGGAGHGNVYETYYGGFARMMPWLGRAPGGGRSR